MQKVMQLVMILCVPLVFGSFIGKPKEKINWLSFEELKLAYAKSPKPILIDVYTGWCGWCKVMDRETYGNDKVISYLNEKYYAVKFDAESSAAVEFGGKTYQFNPGYRAHDLAVYLLQGRLGYPSTILMPSPNAQPAPLAGYMKPSELEAPVKYYGDGAYKSSDFPTFMRAFSAKW